MPKIMHRKPFYTSRFAPFGQCSVICTVLSGVTCTVKEYNILELFRRRGIINAIVILFFQNVVCFIRQFYCTISMFCLWGSPMPSSSTISVF